MPWINADTRRNQAPRCWGHYIYLIWWTTRLWKWYSSSISSVNLQRWIVHLMRNSTRYTSRKDWVKFAKVIKVVYKVVNLGEAKALNELFKTTWSKYGSAIAILEKNWLSLDNLFRYLENIRKLIYSTYELWTHY